TTYEWHPYYGTPFYGSTITYPAQRLSCISDLHSWGYLRAYGATGCYTDVEFAYDLYPTPILIINGDEFYFVCSNGSLSETLTLGSPYDSTCLSLQWYRDGAIISGATNIKYIASVAGSYYLVGTNTAHGCTSTSNTIVIKNLPNPIISALNAGDLCS